MKLIVDSKIFEAFPNFLLGAVVVKNINNQKNKDKTEDILRQAEKETVQKYQGSEVIEISEIACWRDAYRVFGSKPKEYPSSLESVMRRVLKENQLPSINPLVNIYNAMSLFSLLPAGGEDIDKIKGGISLTYASSAEAPIKLLGDDKEEAPYEGEIIYKDEVGALCRRWNWREAERTKLTYETKNAILVLEAIIPLKKEELKNALEKMKEYIEGYCGGMCSFFILESKNPEETL